MAFQNGGWTSLSGRVFGNVYSLAIVGGQLFAAGELKGSDNCPTCASLVLSDGRVWSAAADSLPSGVVTAIIADGLNLLVGGDFSFVGGVNFAILSSNKWVRPVFVGATVAVVHSFAPLGGGCFAIGTSEGLHTVCGRGGVYSVSDRMERGFEARGVVVL
jgi:hypothetical protein